MELAVLAAAARVGVDAHAFQIRQELADQLAWRADGTARFKRVSRVEFRRDGKGSGHESKGEDEVKLHGG